jgi:hypothetical protein
MSTGKGGMLGAGTRDGVRRWIADFALVFMLFWAVALTLGWAHSRAWATSLPVGVGDAINPDRPAARPARLGADEPRRAAGQSIHKNIPDTPAQARLLLSLAFATLAAVNLGFWRHLRRAYATPRRTGSRRG